MLGRPLYINTISQLTGSSVYHSFVLIAWSIFYVAVKRHFALEVERERLLRAETLMHEAKLQALRLQLQPHFLFNTLNALSTLIVEQRTVDASRMVSRIADFLRLTLDEAVAEEIPLEDEIEYARRYMEIEQVRFGDRLAVQIDVDAKVRRALVPSLLLQPLVENAIRHGIANDERDGQVSIAARVDGEGNLNLSIANTGKASCAEVPATSADMNRQNGNGVGLTNTRARLEQLYGDRQSVDMNALKDGGACVRIKLPLEFAK
jgi:LytS/YehU family sensor histidine kinase